MLKIGLTGGIGSGKTTISKVFIQMGIPVFYADSAGHEVLKQINIINKLTSYFGNDILYLNDIDRKKLALIVFSDPKALAYLNSILHPEIIRLFDKWCKIQISPIVIIEAAILFEANFNQFLDYSISVISPLDLKIKRIALRDMLDKAEILKRINSQLSDEIRIQKSDYLIHNNEVQLILPQIIAIYENFLLINR